MEPPARFERASPRYKGGRLPLSYGGLKPTAGVEPAHRPYQGRGLPLSYAGVSGGDWRQKRFSVLLLHHVDLTAERRDLHPDFSVISGVAPAKQPPNIGGPGENRTPVSSMSRKRSTTDLQALVGTARFELAISTTPKWRVSQITPRPDKLSECVRLEMPRLLLAGHADERIVRDAAKEPVVNAEEAQNPSQQF